MFTAPVWFGIFAALGGIVLYVHSRQSTPQPKTVSSTFLWEKVATELASTKRHRRLVTTLLLLLQLLALLVMTIALAEPRRPVTIAPVTFGVIVDTSPNMLVTENGETRFHMARAEAERLLHEADAATYALWSTTPPFQHVVTTSKAQALAALAAMPEPEPHTPSQWENLWPIARLGAPSEDELRLVIVSGGAASPSLPDWFLHRAAGDYYTYVPIGKHQDNFAITHFVARPDGTNPWRHEVAVTVANFSDASTSVPLRLRALRSGIEVDAFQQNIPLRPRSEETVIFGYQFVPDETLTASLLSQDGFPADDEAVLQASAPIPARVALITNNNVYLEQALQAIPDIAWTQRRHLGDTDWSNHPYDVVVFDGIPVPDNFTGYAVTFSAPADPAEPAEPILWWNGSHPLFALVDFNDVNVVPSVGTPTAPTAHVLAQTATGPVITVHEDTHKTIVNLSFSLHGSSLPYEPAFPIMMYNILRSVRPDIGQRVTATSGLLHEPTSNLIPRLFDQLERAGVRPLDDIENLERLWPRTAATEAVGSEPMNAWRLLSLLTVLIVVGEGWLYFGGRFSRARPSTTPSPWEHRTGARSTLQSRPSRPALPAFVQRLRPHGLRTAALLCLLLALSGWTWWQQAPGMTLHFIIDESLSVDGKAREKAASLFAAALPRLHPDTNVRVYAFGQQTRWAGDMTVSDFTLDDGLPASSATAVMSRLSLPQVNSSDTDIESALRYVHTHLHPEENHRLVLFSDGRETTGNVMEALTGRWDQAVPIDVVPADAQGAPEVYVGRVVAPTAVTQREPFDVRVTIMANVDTPASVELVQNGTVVGVENVQLSNGANTVTFSRSEGLPPDALGAVDFEVRVRAAADTMTQNNVGYAVVTLDEAADVLIVAREEKEGDTLARLLRSQGVRAVTRSLSTDGFPHGELTAYRAIVLVDVPAWRLSGREMAEIEAEVRRGGNGLLVIGGPQSFGPGEYKNTLLEDVLPVETHTGHDTTDPSVALLLVLDTSGSMNDTQGAFSKLDLAKEAALGALELMHPQDHIGVIGFDSRARWVVPLENAGNYWSIASRIATLAAEGGTNLGAAMIEAIPVMAESDAAIKHVIALTDGRSVAADFSGLTRQLGEVGATVSTVGIGRDADQSLLRDIAQWGGGRFYYTDDIKMVPQIFVTETTVIARPATAVELFQPFWDDAPDFWRTDQPLPPLGGYVLASPKERASVHLSSPEGDPVLATWRYGLGRAAAMLANPLGSWSGRWVDWDGHALFMAQLVRSLMRETPASGWFVEADVTGRTGRVTVDAIDEQGAFVNFLPLQADIIHTQTASIASVPMTQAAPGRYEATFQAEHEGAYTIYVRDDHRQSLVASTGVIVPYAHEYVPTPGGHALLNRIAAMTGGLTLTDIENVPWERWLAHPSPTSRPVNMQSWAMAAALMLFFADVVARYIRRDDTPGLADTAAEQLHRRIREQAEEKARRDRQNVPLPDRAEMKKASDARRFLATKRRQNIDGDENN